MEKDLSYILNHLGEPRHQYFNAISPPVMQTSNYAFDTVKSLREKHFAEHEDYFYGRAMNPVTEMLNQKMAALEGTESALSMGSGMAAISAAIMANVQAGDHIVSTAPVYHHTDNLLRHYLPRFGVTTTFADGSHPPAIERSITPNTKILYLESPTSYSFKLQDLAQMVEIAKKHGLITIIDNSYASPLFQQPAQMGVDLVVHSATKYIGGHSDTLAGIVCGSKQQIQKILKSELMTLGGLLAPHNAWLLLRGLRTLEVRMQRSHQSGLQVARFLESHPTIKQVNHPFLSSHPQHALAKSQMQGTGGLFSATLNVETVAQVEQFCDALRYFVMAVSWGGHESLIFPACAINPANQPEPNFNFIRFYVGLENPDVLIKDLENGFAAIGGL